MNSKMMKRLALQKWRFLSRKDYAYPCDAKMDLELHNPRLREFKCNCSYCENYVKCKGCPLRGVGLCCEECASWFVETTKANAKRMYNKIKALEVKI